MELIGLYLIGSALLVVAGVAKAIRPGDTARALAEVASAGASALRGLVRIGAACEAVVGLAAVLLPRPLPAALVCASYLGFAAYVVVRTPPARAPWPPAVASGSPTPRPPGSTSSVNLVLAAAAGVVAVQATDASTLRSVLTAQPWAGLPLLLASAVGLWLTYQALALLPSLGDGPTAPGRSVPRP